MLIRLAQKEQASNIEKRLGQSFKYCWKRANRLVELLRKPVRVKKPYTQLITSHFDPLSELESGKILIQDI